jgi:2-pyrone-4,6-dicarboxylate lactonase
MSSQDREIPVCMAPDPDTRTPKYKAPPGACDAHCHIFGPGDRYPYAPDRSYTPPDAPLERFIELQKTLGLERAVLVNASCHGTDNTVILDAIAQSGGRYRGVANVDESVTDAELERLHEGGVRGIRFNFVQHLGGTPDLDEFDRLVHRVAPLGWHVVLHFDAKDLLDFDALLGKLPVPFIIDHMGRVPTKGRPGSGAVPHSAERTAAGQRLGEDLRRRAHFLSRAAVHRCGAVRAGDSRIAPDRTLWGTDWPHPNIKKHMPNDGDLVDLIPLFMPDEALQKKVLVDNPHRLYGFTG